MSNASPQNLQLSTAVFGLLLAAIGIWGLAAADFVAIWAPGIQPAQLRPAMAIACSVISLATGVGLLWPRTCRLAARILLAFLCLWLVWSKAIALIHAAAAAASWESLGETAVVLSAAWALSFTSREPGPRILYGLSLIAFAAGHLGYLALTASLVPVWLPWHVGWVYLTAATYAAAGIALLAGRFTRLAATLSALQMALFGVLIWLPKIAAGARDMDTLNETAISFALAASGWVVANALTGSLREGPHCEV